jgi:hypothetical protein
VVGARCSPRRQKRSCSDSRVGTWLLQMAFTSSGSVVQFQSARAEVCVLRCCLYGGLLSSPHPGQAFLHFRQVHAGGMDSSYVEASVPVLLTFRMCACCSILPTDTRSTAKIHLRQSIASLLLPAHLTFLCHTAQVMSPSRVTFMERKTLCLKSKRSGRREGSSGEYVRGRFAQ